MKHYVVEYLDRTPLRVFTIDVEKTEQNTGMMNSLIARMMLRINKCDNRDAHVNYFCQPEWPELKDRTLNLMIVSLETGRQAPVEFGKPTIPHVLFADINCFCKHIGYNIHTDTFTPTSVAGMRDNQIGR